MSLEDEIDGPTALKKPARRPRPALRVRHVVYLQLLAVMLCVVFGQCERWGYGDVLETGIPGAIFSPIVLTLFWTAPIVPAAMIVVLQGEGTRRITAWMAALLCFAMSFAQFLALLPLVQ